MSPPFDPNYTRPDDERFDFAVDDGFRRGPSLWLFVPVTLGLAAFACMAVTLWRGW